MSEHTLVALASAMRGVLSTPAGTATATDPASETARMDLIDMIPDLERALIGERDTIRNMTWTVKISFLCSRYLHFG